MKIAVCGKGGSGKSTVTSLLAFEAQFRGLTSLVVDSDESNSGLYRMLGFEQPPIPLMDLVGGKKGLKEKMSQPAVLTETEIHLKNIPPQYRQKKNGLMLVSIGKILQALEGCACPIGVLSREFLKKLHLEDNEIAIIDMEAGVEHFGRGIDNSIDTALLVVEPSFESITVAEKIRDLAADIKKDFKVVLNKMSSDRLISKMKAELKGRNIQIIGVIPDDPTVFEACLEGCTLSRGEAAFSAGKVLDALLAEQ
jgi:CO dehydrogenase maturation factor